MLPLALPSGLSGFLTDAREFLAAVRFARPDLLWLLLLLPLLALANRYAAARRRRAVAEVGRPAAVAGLQTHPVRRNRWLGIAYPLGWLALVLGLAGPRWGKSDESGVAVGRDLVVVVDLSRSMLAADMASGEHTTRWEAAKAGLRDLMAAVSRRGGHRVALVVFAARPQLVCPLTTDYDHVRAKVEELDGRYPPPETRPGADPTIASGTRIGAALAAAVAAHDNRFPGHQDVILISDGDDPADDREWARGADAARRAKVPVHAFGLGDPDQPSLIYLGDQPLEAPLKEDEPADLVRTRLHEDVLRQVAAETRGEYVAARRELPRLGEFFRSRIEPLPPRDVSDDSVPQPKERYAWFLAPALALFALGWLRGR
jgi:Ca-activated chloride channel family protein